MAGPAEGDCARSTTSDICSQSGHIRPIRIHSRRRNSFEVVGVTVTSTPVQGIADIEHSLAEFAKEPNGSLIVAPFPLIITNQDTIIALASELHLPAIYPFRYFAANGGLASYGFDTVAPHREAASYVDRILKGKSRPTCPCRHRPSTNCDQPKDCEGPRSYGFA